MRPTLDKRSFRSIELQAEFLRTVRFSDDILIDARGAAALEVSLMPRRARGMRDGGDPQSLGW